MASHLRDRGRVCRGAGDDRLRLPQGLPHQCVLPSARTGVLPVGTRRAGTGGVVLWSGPGIVQRRLGGRNIRLANNGFSLSSES